jgi:hypothetical protein
MVQMAKRLAQRPTQRLAQRHSLRDSDRKRMVDELSRELGRLKMEDRGLRKKPGLLSRLMNKQGSLITGRAGTKTSKETLSRIAARAGVSLSQVEKDVRAAVGGIVPKLEKRGYKLQGQTEVQGIPIAIENQKGSVRKGTDRDGHRWRTRMSRPYGYIKGTKGADGDEVDAFVGPNKKSPNAFVVHQRKPDGKGYDEDKVILGVNTKAEARRLFLQHYDDPKFLGPIAKVSTERLKELVASKKRLVKISQVSYAAMLDELLKHAP